MPSTSPGSQEVEPQLKFEALHGDLDRILQDETISCLCLSDKILALGTEEGRVHVLDYCGNQVRCLVLHKARVNELSIDAAEEYVASCSDDGSVFVMGLCGDLCLKHEQGTPVKALAIDPRFASRKTKEFVSVSETGAVQLSTQGWLGRSEYALGQDAGAATAVGRAQVVRWWQDLVAWASDSALMVYCSLQHRVICTVRRPKAPAAPRAPAALHAPVGPCKPSLLFGQNSHVYVSWPDCVKVVRVTSGISGAATAEQICELRQPDHLMVMGVSPFGRDLALLTVPAPNAHGSTQEPQQQPSQAQQQQQQQQQQQGNHAHTQLGASDSSNPQLRIVSHQGCQLAADALPLPLLPPPRPPTPTPSSAGKGAPPTRHEQPPLMMPCFQLVPSLPSTTTEATTSFTWSKGLAALAALPAYATAVTAATAASAVSAVGSSPSRAPAGAAMQGQGLSTQAQQQQQQQQLGGGRASGLAAFHDAAKAQEFERGTSDADAASELLTFFIVSPKMVFVAHPRDANDRVLWLVEVGRFEEALAAAEAGLRAAHSLTNGDVAQGKGDDGLGPGGSSAADGAGTRAAAGLAAAVEEEEEEGVGPKVGCYGVTRETYDKAVQAYIGWLLSSGSFALAASMSWRLLGRSASAWERWVYLFAQARQLPLLAPHLPTESPRLKTGLYDIVLASLLTQPEHHVTALKLVRAWPPSLFSMPQLMDTLASRMKRPGGDSRELSLLLAELYERQARPDLALATYLQLREPRALELLEAGAGPAGRGAAALLAPMQSGGSAATAVAAAGGVAGPAAVAALLDLDEDRALEALVRHVETLPPAHVVDALQEAEFNYTGSGAADGGKGSMQSQRLRRALWRYLAAVMASEPTVLAPEHAHLAIVLAAEYAPPGKLLDMLSGSGGAGAPLIPLEAALAVCEEHGMVAEQVYLLGRMGNASQALHLIIDKLEDIPQAIEFVRGQRDDELWEQLMSWALGSPETTGALLDHIGGHINPLSLIRRLPPGASIPRLRDRIISIITDFRTQTSLHEGCNTILRSDCAHLISKLYASIRAQVPSVYIKCSSWHALKHHQHLRRALGSGGSSSMGSVANAGPAGVWLRYEAAATAGAPAANPPQLPVLQPLLGPQGLPQGLLPAVQAISLDNAPALQQGADARQREEMRRAAQQAWVGCIAPDAAAEDAPSTSAHAPARPGAQAGSLRLSAKRQQRGQHSYLHARHASSQHAELLPALVHLS